MAAFAFVSHGEAAVAEQPGDGSLDLPPVPPQALGRLDARAVYTQASLDATGLDTVPLADVLSLA